MHRVSSRPRLVSDADAAFSAGDEVDGDEVQYAALMGAVADETFTELLNDTRQAVALQGYMDVEEQYISRNVNSDVNQLEVELRGMFADGSNSSAVVSSKRKRLSNYMTPVSSYTNLKSSLIHPLCDDVSAAGVDASCALFNDLKPAAVSICCFNNSTSSINDLPPEALVHMASFLAPSQIRTLSLVNTQFRDILINSQGAVESLWMHVLREQFPQVFVPDGKMLTSSDVQFVNASVPASTGSCSGVGSASSESDVTLALSTALFPKCYPMQIDEATFKMYGTRHPFRTFSLNVGSLNLGAHIDKENKMDVVQETDSEIVPVVQFMGRVGTGDRCIRSDQPFPSIKKIDGCVKKSGHMRLSWKLKSKSGICKSFDNIDSDASATSQPSTPLASTSFASPSTRTPLQRLSNAQSPPHSRLLRFLSSLSHHTDTSIQGSLQSSSMDWDEDDIGVNNYGMFNFGKCKEKLGRIARGCMSKHVDNNLKPFVVPVVLSKEQYHQSSLGPEKKLVVDLNPRLCAYFEVTILKHSGPNQGEDEIITGNGHRNENMDARQFANPPLAPRHLHELPRRQRWRNPHHILPMHPLAAIVFLQDGDMWLPPLPMHRELQNQNHVARVPFQDRGRGARHECVAIGLSTLAFNPRDRMPGWDTNSFGYHGDDGGLFHGQGDMIRPFGPAFGPGDTVGCGFCYTSKRMFFVKNGLFLGYAFDTLGDDVLEGGLYPTVGVDTECPLFVNFGAKPFCFDLSKFVRGCCNVGDA
jgi:hypothetical protein